MMRISRNRDVNKEYQCCLCIHVRTGTMMLALFQLILLSIGMGSLTGNLMNSFNRTNTNNPMLELEMAIQKPHHTESPAVLHHRQTIYLYMAQIGLGMLFTGMLLHGALKRKPYYLMPYFCMQVLEFVITSLSLVQTISFMPDIKLWIQHKEDLPYKEQLLACSHLTLLFLVMSFFFFVMALKAYFIGMVWACYKYLVLNPHGTMPPPSIADPETGLLINDPVNSQDFMPPPKYDEVLKTPANAFMPPPYYPDPPTGAEGGTSNPTTVTDDLPK